MSMVIQKKMIKASLKYLNEDKPKYSTADIIVYRVRLGKAWTNREKRRSGLKIGLGAILCVVGAVTLWLPSGSIFLIGAGCSLMVDGGLDLWRYYRKAERKADLVIWGLGLR